VAGLALAAAGALAGYALRDSGSGCEAFARGAADLSAARYEAAVSELSEALRADPTDPAARLALARAYAGRGWKAEARKQLELAATGARETLRGAYLELGRIEGETGNREDARRYRQKADGLGN
jgi:tetratricopeptide (TPR) repeat protein